MVAFLFGASALGITAASADPRDRRHDDDGVTLSVTVGDSYDDRSYGGRYDDNRYDRRGDRGRHYGNDRGGSRVVKRRVYDTRYRARIFLVEEVYYSRRGSNVVCTIDVRGPESRRVPRERLRRIANNECSRRARIRYS
jgi:hypothetical protein